MQTIVSANMERNVIFTDAMANILELLESRRPIDCSDQSVKVLRLGQKIPRLSVLVVSRAWSYTQCQD